MLTPWWMAVLSGGAVAVVFGAYLAMIGPDITNNDSREDNARVSGLAIGAGMTMVLLSVLRFLWFARIG